jgi:hypothetical protein
LKNVKGEFIPLVEEDAKTWMPLVYQVLPEDQRAKLKRVWNMWRDVNLFSLENWKQMGECFSASVNNQFRAVRNTIVEQAGLLHHHFSLSCIHYSLFYIGRWDSQTSNQVA